MSLEEYSAESLSFSGVTGSARLSEDATGALAQKLNEWAEANPGRRVLQLTPLLVKTSAEWTEIAAMIVHTAGSDMSPELAEQVAAAVEEALEEGGPLDAEEAPFPSVRPVT